MKKFLFIFASIFLSSCTNRESADLEPAKKIVAPIEINTDYDSFKLKGQTYSLPLSFEEFEKNGFYINENEYYHPNINKSQQIMVNMKADGSDVSATFKNTKDGPIDTKDGTIIELYINNQDGKNQDFSIHDLAWGTSYEEASKALKDLNTEQAATENDRTLNYYTDDNFVSLYFANNELSSVAIFSKSFMRDENYVGGEFAIFGQTVKFPLSIRDLEELLSSDFNINKDGDNQNLDPGEETTYRVYSPMYEKIEDKNSSYGMDFYLKNTSDKPMSYEDAKIIKLVAENSSDLSVGNAYVGASIDELKKMDKKNQNPRRLLREGKNKDGTLKMVFSAENNTNYIFNINEKTITHIEVINQKEQ